MKTIEFIPMIVTVLLALVGYLLTYTNNVRLAQRKDRLDRVERQLRDLYGPLLSRAEAADRVWRAFRNKYRPTGGYWNETTTDAEAVAWRMWMSTVFQPLNEEMAALVTSHGDLVEEVTTPECLLELYAHVVAYRPVLDAWSKGDFSSHTSLFNFPVDSLLQYARQHSQRLKAEQARLLGRAKAIGLRSDKSPVFNR